jgi:hypothetical protein
MNSFGLVRWSGFPGTEVAGVLLAAGATVT